MYKILYVYMYFVHYILFIILIFITYYTSIIFNLVIFNSKMVVHLKLNIYLSSVFLRENFITAMIANSIMLLYRARAALKLLIRNRVRFRINPVLRFALSVSIRRTILRIYLQSNTLSTRRSRKFCCGKQRTRRGNKEENWP